MDERTVQAAREGDRTALATLLRGLQDVWFRFALNLLGDSDLAADAAQETGLRFLKRVAGFRGESQLQTWSLGIALNVVREIRRKNRPVPDAGRAFLKAVETPAECPLASADWTERRGDLRSLLAGLPDRQREAVVLRFFEELSVGQTAAAMKCAQGTVKATVHQALRSLRSQLTGEKETRSS